MATAHASSRWFDCEFTRVQTIMKTAIIPSWLFRFFRYFFWSKIPKSVNSWSKLYSTVPFWEIVQPLWYIMHWLHQFMSSSVAVVMHYGFHSSVQACKFLEKLCPCPMPPEYGMSCTYNVVFSLLKFLHIPYGIFLLHNVRKWMGSQCQKNYHKYLGWEKPQLIIGCDALQR